LDLVTVADLATWTTAKITYMSPNTSPWNDELAKIYGPEGSAITSYVCSKIGGERHLLSRLFSQLAWSFADMRRLEQYFRSVNLMGSGSVGMRLWGLEIYSE
jgi:hypothetical protein